MPAILKRLTSQLIAKGYEESHAIRIATHALQKAGDLDSHGEATAKGERRGAMSPSQRAISRAAKRSGRPLSHYKYDPGTNRATLIRKRKRS